MPERRTTPVDLLPALYEAAVVPEQWPQFLERLAGLFNSQTASLRVVDSAAPVVHQSFTVGFEPVINHHYVENLASQDPFPAILRANPPGKVICSHQHIDDHDFERSEHYQTVLRPNGNFYLMGTHVERSNGRALQLGIHRPSAAGFFQEHERCRLEFFSPHFLQAARIMRRMGALESALQQARAVLNRLPFAVWLLDRQLRPQWLNAAAEEVLRTASHGLALQNSRLTINSDAPAGELLRLQKALNQGHSQLGFVRIGYGGSLLVLLADPVHDVTHRLGDGEGILVFLLDPESGVQPDGEVLREIYALTRAETRLVTELVQGYDLGQASARLGVTLHTVRSQLKSAMRKTDSNRQSDLVRKILLGPGSLDLAKVYPFGH